LIKFVAEVRTIGGGLPACAETASSAVGLALLQGHRCPYSLSGEGRSSLLLPPSEMVLVMLPSWAYVLSLGYSAASGYGFL
jgi:hypothetical protein